MLRNLKEGTMKRRKLFYSSLIITTSFYALLFTAERVEAHGTYVGPTEYGSWSTVGCCGQADTRQKRTVRSRYRYDYNNIVYQHSPPQQREDGLVNQLLAGIDQLLGVFNISSAFATPAPPPSVSPPDAPRPSMSPPDAPPPSASPDSVNSESLLARGPWFHWHSDSEYRCTGEPSSTCPDGY